MGALPVHHTATTDAPWDGPAAVAVMPDKAGVKRHLQAHLDDGEKKNQGDPFVPLDDRLRAKLPPKPTARGNSWYSITNATSDEPEVYLYDEIGGWFGSTADQFVAELNAITAPRMKVRVNSPGGSVFDGVAIANALRAHPADVTVQVDGIAASIASVIAMAGDRVVMMPNSTVMIHDASGVCMGNSADMAQMGELLDVLSNNIADAYAAKAGGTREDWRAAMQKETWYLPDDAVAAGLADEVGGAPSEDTATVPAEPATPDEPATPAAPAMAGMAAAATVSNVLRQFDEGDRVRVVGTPHEPGHTEGVIAVVNGNAYGIIFDTPDDDTEPGEPYFWYVDNELEFVAEGPDGGGQGDGYAQPAEPEPEEEAEPLLPGVSHPMGRPVPTGQAAAQPAQAAEPDEWAASVAHLLVDPAANAWAAEIAHLITPDSSSSAATEA